MTRPPNRARRIFDYLMDRPGVEVSTYVLERLAGRRSWRTAVSIARLTYAKPLRRDIVNTQHWSGKGPRRRCDSRYALVKLPRKAA